MSVSPRSVLLLAFLVLLSDPAGAQTSATIPKEITCSGAELQFELLEDPNLTGAPSAADLASWMHATCARSDPYFFAIIDQATHRAVGVASYLRVNPDSGSIEVGHINFSPRLQSTIAATEAMYLMMRWAFMAGYRRYEWKCNALKGELFYGRESRPKNT